MAITDECDDKCAKKKRPYELPLIAGLEWLLFQYVVPELIEFGVVHAMFGLEQAYIASESLILSKLGMRLEVVEQSSTNDQISQRYNNKRDCANVFLLHVDASLSGYRFKIYKIKYINAIRN